MSLRFDDINGFPPRLYRTPEQIRLDILDIREKIEEINQMLNIRNLISEVILETSEENEARRIEAVSELIDYANEALSEMRMLEEALDELKDELSESIRFSK